MNVNGLRAAEKRGFCEWLLSQDPDIACIQEIRLQEKDVSQSLRNAGKFTGFFHYAKRPGYSGVGIYSKRKPDIIEFGCGIESIDEEGRFMKAKFGELVIVSIYVPSGSSSDRRLKIKFDFMEKILPVLEKLITTESKLIICGDWNVAHERIDLKNWRSNQKNSGFLPTEREWFSSLIEKLGYVDVFRHLIKESNHYTWWSNRGKAWENNVGWRIDYQMASPSLAEQAITATIFKEKRLSDHAPLIIDYDYLF